jgi:hypothetical protein
MGEFDNEFSEYLTDTDSALKFAKHLRNAADHSRRKFFEFLMAIEQRAELWNCFGATFSSYLAKCHLCQAGVYEDWKKGFASIDVNVADAIGFHGTKAIAKVPPAKLAECTARMLETVKNEGGVPLSRFRAETLAAGFSPKPPEPPEPVISYAQLKKENERLRRKVERLEEQLAAAKSKAGKKRERGADDQPSAN